MCLCECPEGAVSLPCLMKISFSKWLFIPYMHLFLNRTGNIEGGGENSTGEIVKRKALKKKPLPLSTMVTLQSSLPQNDFCFLKKWAVEFHISVVSFRAQSQVPCHIKATSSCQWDLRSADTGPLSGTPAALMLPDHC